MSTIIDTDLPGGGSERVNHRQGAADWRALTLLRPMVQPIPTAA